MSLLHMATAQKDTSKKTTQQDATHTKAKFNTTSKSLGQKPTNQITQEEPSPLFTAKRMEMIQQVGNCTQKNSILSFDGCTNCNTNYS